MSAGAMRGTIVRGVLVLGVVALPWWLTVRHTAALTDDFISYWAASRLLAGGGDPYRLEALLAVQRSVGWPYLSPLPVWYGPWILATAAPFGLLPYWPARVAWLLLQIAGLLASAALLARVYAYAPQSRVPLLLAITSAPAILCLAEGQVTPLALLGIAAFALCAGRGRDWLAGAALFPATAKPLTLYLLFIALALWVVRTRRFRVIAGLLAATAAGSLVAVLLRPAVFSDWIRLSRAVSPLAQAYTPTIGTLLRGAFGVRLTWLAYLPVVAGLAWFAVAWADARATRDWRATLPMLTLASLLTAPFAWSHDAVLLLPAILQRARRGLSRFDRYAWMLLNALAVALYPLLRYRQAPYILYPAAILVWSLLDRDAGADHQQVRPRSAGYAGEVRRAGADDVDAHVEAEGEM